MSEKATFRRDDDGTIRITGDLTLDTVASLFERSGAGTRRGAGSLSAVDLAGVGRVDSSGLALLLEWEAANGQQDLEVRNAPEDLLSLARLCDAEELLTLNGRTPGV